MEERKPRFTSLSGLPIARVYSLDDLKGWTAETDLGRHGESHITRGVYPTMYRGRLWTMRQFAGFGTAEDTNRCFAYLLQQGQNGLSVDFDLLIFFFQAEDGIRDYKVTGVQTCALPI